MDAIAKIVRLAPPPSGPLTVKQSSNHRAQWLSMQPDERPCFTPQLLKELRDAQNEAINNSKGCIVLSSQINGVFSLGGDLRHIVKLIRCQDRNGLDEYMKACIELIEPMAYSDLPYRIALVQGTAQGGGFEAALCCDLIVAEEQASFGLPEIGFNLFPGMGAFQNLLRRVPAQMARRIIESGERYSAKEMAQMGIVDLVVEPGQGIAAIDRIIEQRLSKQNGYDGIQEMYRYTQPKVREQLLEVGKIWVQRALKLQEKELRRMEVLASAQERSMLRTA